MTPERAREVERICQAALEREPSARAAFLTQACESDDALRQEVESLLAQEAGAPGFLSTPAAVLTGDPSGDSRSIVGRRLGVYEILAQIGEGGMGQVYRARDTKLGRDVAIKILPPAFTSDPERLARFAREARVLATLNHPHIGAIYGLEDAGPVRALVLELVEGPTLADRIERGRIPMAEALTIARQIADALEGAHEKGIVHRDLKPANVKLTPAGVVKVLDFGLAKIGAGGAGEAGRAGGKDPTNSPAITVSGTRDGVLLGTAAYMSPEQARGQAVDKRADIWAFGCVLYEMLTGRAAFSGATVSDTLATILGREPDWTALPNATSSAIHRLLRRCLEKDARLRLHDIADARIEIDEALHAEHADHAPQPRSRSLKVAMAAALMGAAVLGAWAISRFRQPDAVGSVLRLQINPPQGGQFGGPELPELALSPNGRMAVFGAAVGGKHALWLRSLDDTNASLLPGTEDASSPFWSPDGNAIAFFSHGKLRRIDIAGGTPFAICDVPRAYGGSWAPDGRILVGIFAGTLMSVPASGGTLSPLTTLDRSSEEVVHAWPQVLPGGHFLYLAGSTKHEPAIYAASFAKPNERLKLFTTETRALYASSPDGHGYLLWGRAGTLVAQEFDGAALKFSGEVRPLADGVGVRRDLGSIPVAVSTNGTLVYAPADLWQLTWFDRAGKRLGTVGDPGVFSSVSTRVSPDGKQIATSHHDTRELWVIDADRGTSRRTTHNPGGGFSPQWSPDGRTILFYGGFLYRKDPTGVVPDERIADSSPYSRLTDWSRDGRFVLSERNTVETQNDIWVMTLTSDGHVTPDSQPRPFLRTPVNESEARFSREPNPRWVAYRSDESGRDEIYVQSFPEPHGPHQISVRGGTRPQWGPGSRELFYQSPDNKVMVVNLKLGSNSVEASSPRELFTIPLAIPLQSFFEVAPDGQRFLVPVPDPIPHPLNVIVNWPALLKPMARQ